MKNKKGKKSKEKKVKKVKKVKKSISLMEDLRNQSDLKNELDCAPILEQLNKASLDGEYVKVVELKINQAHYIKALGVNVKDVASKFGFYEVSWQYDVI